MEARLSVLSVPAQRVLCHDRRRDLLSPYAAALAAVTSLAAAAARSHAAITSTAHPSSCATRDGAVGHTAGAGDGAGALVSNALVAVPAGDEEHGRTISHGTNNGSSCNSCASRVDLAARAGVTSQGATIARASGRRRGGVSTGDVGT